MDYNQIFAISAAGMALQRTHVEVAALNLANADTVQAEGSAPYRPLRVVSHSVMQGPAGKSAGFGALIDGALNQLPEARIEAGSRAPRMVHEPGHPAANAQGFIARADVDSVAEMVSLMRATRAYEANLTALKIGRAIALKTLEIGGRS